MSDLEQRIKGYEKAYADDYGFEKEMVKARQMYIAELILEQKPKTVLEIGCGSEQLFSKLMDYDFIERWIIVEPSDEFVQAARSTIQDERVSIIQGFIEQVVENETIESVDLCLCSGLLHEVESPKLILNAARNVTKSSGLIHINVPNALSMHRLLAVEMGLISSTYESSERNKALAQFHIFDKTSLTELTENSGLHIESTGGYFIKPFSHTQMEKVVDVIGKDVLIGLYRLGCKMPDMASEIYVNARVVS